MEPSILQSTASLPHPIFELDEAVPASTSASGLHFLIVLPILRPLQLVHSFELPANLRLILLILEEDHRHIKAWERSMRSSHLSAHTPPIDVLFAPEVPLLTYCGVLHWIVDSAGWQVIGVLKRVL